MCSCHAAAAVQKAITPVRMHVKFAGMTKTFKKIQHRNVMSQTLKCCLDVGGLSEPA